MTVYEAIAQVDRLRDNTVPTDIKIGWLSKTDEYFYEEIMKGREGAPAGFEPYNEEDMGRALLIPSPYDELYQHKLEAMIYYEQREIKKYASSMALYNQAMNEYIRKYVREHAALPHPNVKYW